MEITKIAECQRRIDQAKKWANLFEDTKGTLFSFPLEERGNLTSVEVESTRNTLDKLIKLAEKYYYRAKEEMSHLEKQVEFIRQVIASQKANEGNA